MWVIAATRSFLRQSVLEGLLEMEFDLLDVVQHD
jgi:hypothetical protein